MNHILVIGATGTVGRQVLSQLAATDAQVRAMARNPAAACLPPQAEVVRGDLTLPKRLIYASMESIRCSSCGPPQRQLLCPLWSGS